MVLNIEFHLSYMYITLFPFFSFSCNHNPPPSLEERTTRTHLDGLEADEGDLHAAEQTDDEERVVSHVDSLQKHSNVFLIIQEDPDPEETLLNMGF